MDDLLMEVRRTPHAAYLDDLLMKGRRTPPIPHGQNVERRALGKLCFRRALSGRALGKHCFRRALFRHLVCIKKLTESYACFFPCSCNCFPRKGAICIPARKNEPQWYPFPLKWPTLWHNRRCFELESTNNLPLNSVSIRARYF